MKADSRFFAAALAVGLFTLGAGPALGASCSTCHSAEYNLWAGSPHANTQAHPALGLGEWFSGHSPADVVQGLDCVTCHAPTGTLANGGMEPADALGYFFTTSNGRFSAGTAPTNTAAWPHVGCTACHQVDLAIHDFYPATLAFFDSRTRDYVAVTNSAQLCGQCHGSLQFHDARFPVYDHWLTSGHARSQTNVALGLSRDRCGQTPADVISGPQADNCIACHAPRSVLFRGGDEALALGSFFTTAGGVFTSNTVPANVSEWPGVDCTTCHDPHAPGQLSYFNSSTKRYQVMASASQLCGQCHGNLRFPDTQYRLYNAWAESRHAHSQTNVAAQLSQARAGQTPAEVMHGPNAENCIGCHAPTAVLATGADETETLSYFFSTADGRFSTNTVSAHADQWPGVDCTACHDPHNSGRLAYFNSATRQYQPMADSNQLCGQCHGNLRFPNSKYLTYNLVTGTGGIGVPDEALMGDVSCTECHMLAGSVAGSNSKNFAGHSWAITVFEPDGSMTVSCIACHTGATPEMAYRIIDGWKANYREMAATASTNVARVAAFLEGTHSPAAQAALAEAQHNLAYALADESGGFHNNPYLMSLLRAANQRALSISFLKAATENGNIVLSWIGSGTLQAADSMSGPWRDVPGTPNPLVLVPSAQAAQRYYRLRP